MTYRGDFPSFILRSGETVSRKAHDLENAGSNPASATNAGH